MRWSVAMDPVTTTGTGCSWGGNGSGGARAPGSRAGLGDGEVNGRVRAPHRVGAAPTAGGHEVHRFPRTVAGQRAAGPSGPASSVRSHHPSWTVATAPRSAPTAAPLVTVST